MRMLCTRSLLYLNEIAEGSHADKIIVTFPRLLEIFSDRLLH